MYVFFRLYTWDGSQWRQTETVQYIPAVFKSAGYTPSTTSAAQPTRGANNSSDQPGDGTDTSYYYPTTAASQQTSTTRNTSGSQTSTYTTPATQTSYRYVDTDGDGVADSYVAVTQAITPGAGTGVTNAARNANTADDSPIGTMLMLAALSALLGSIVMIRRKRS